MRPKTIDIHSKNSDFQQVDALRRNREKRQKSRQFLVEGVKPIELAIAHGWQIAAFLYSREMQLSHWAEGVLLASRAERHLELPLALMQELSEKNETSELMAVVKMPVDSLSRIPLRAPLLVVVLDRPSSPGNLGTTLRSCDALGAAGVVVTGHTADLYDPKTVRASVGTLFSLPAVRVPSSKELQPWLESLHREHGARIVGTTARSELDVAEHDFTQPTVLLFGNETTGLSAHYKSLCDSFVTIAMRGAASSLNVACAASIVLYEIDRQRRGAR
jgi:23S rRNA (uridine2479-2'-O)-methyltransferase